MVNADLQNNFFHHRPEKQLRVSFQCDGVFVLGIETLLRHKIELEGQKWCILSFSLIKVKNSSLFSFLTSSIFSPIYHQSLSSLFHVTSTFKYHPNPYSCCYIPPVSFRCPSSLIPLPSCLHLYVLPPPPIADDNLLQTLWIHRQINSS